MLKANIFYLRFRVFLVFFLGFVHYSQYDEEAGREDKEEVRGSLEE